MRVKMFPDIDMFGESEGGIRRVVEAYHEYAQPGIDYVGVDELDYDLIAVHAGATTDIPHDKPFVLHLHGLYWTGDYHAPRHEYRENAALVHNLRLADVVTVPSHFVARSLRRDMRLEPIVVGHGIDPREWKYDGPKEDYILWNKNRTGDVCSPEAVTELAARFKRQRFITTFADEKGKRLRNVVEVGTMPHADMRPLVQKAAVYLATTQETFGIGVVEAMAAGTPILGFKQGALPEIVNRNCGYLAKPGDYDDLAHGLEVIRENYAAMSRACVVSAFTYHWTFATEKVRDVYKIAVRRFNQPHTYSVVIPVYNKGDTIERTIRSVQAQTVSPDEIIVVDNNSTDDSVETVYRLADDDKRIVVVNEPRQGVAHARNRGCSNVTSRHIICLDGDDEIDPAFGERCLAVLKRHRDVGVAYTKLRVIDGDERRDATWPPEYDFDGFLRRFNQVPTCAMFRRDLWKRLGGYRQRYAPRGAGSEDAEFWLRMGAMGYRGMRVDETLFSYHTGGATSHPEYAEKDWLGWHPWTRDQAHPLASWATPQNHISHPVRSYDIPLVSVIIPVAPSHLEFVMDALDSLESQTFRNWEAIVILDGDNAPLQIKAAHELAAAYPYATIETTRGKKLGAGGARNSGVHYARGQFLLFLDADDMLHPEAIEAMVGAWANFPNHIIYTDYHVIHRLDKKSREELRQAGRLVYSTPEEGDIVRYQTYDYDCVLAQQQPRDDGRGYYLWCNVTSLVPKTWHEGIGGFDENMEAWEDWDYWIRLARKGVCFYRVNRPLLTYRFDTGLRRRIANQNETGDDGRQQHEMLLSYMRNKNKEDAVGCRSCGGRKSSPQPYAAQAMPVRSMNQGAMANVKAEDLVTVQLVDGNTAKHPISIRGTSYGYRRTGDKFKMLRAHAALDGRIVVLENETPVMQEAEPIVAEAPKPVTPPAPAAAPEEPSLPIELPEVVKIWGINEERAEKLKEIGIDSIESFRETDPDEIRELLGVTPLVLKRMVDSASKL